MTFKEVSEQKVCEQLVGEMIVNQGNKLKDWLIKNLVSRPRLFKRWIALSTG